MSLPKSFNSASRSVSEKLHGGYKGPRGSKGPGGSYLNQVGQKLKEHPDYKRISAAEVKRLAKKLTNTDSVKEYFSEILQVQIAEYCVVKASGADFPEGMELADGLTDTLDTGEQSAVSINAASQGACALIPVMSSLSCRVKDLAAFPVKLYLTSLPDDPMIGENTYASMLESRFGPMVASMQIGNVMLEWTRHNLVIPHYNVPPGPKIETDITEIASQQLQQKARECRDSQTTGRVIGQVDLMLEVSKSVYAMIKSIIMVIATWNRFHYYHVYSRNSQHFAQHIMKLLGIEEHPLHKLEVNTYRDRLRSDVQSTTQTVFSNHAHLDSYVQQNIHELKTCDMEYLLTEYYRYHLVAREGCVGADSWTCREADCQMQSLELGINRDELLITSIHRLN